MKVISPVLQDRLNNQKNVAFLENKKETENKHEKIYNDLTNKANQVKPNEPKAKLVDENLLEAGVSAIKGVGSDSVNFVKAVKTGKMSDNNLGRINDLGMKAGGVLIASYLATKAKTKTEALMQFIGGGAFFASMALWPKLFINLPAKLVHKVDIGKKYISAQGDKKDLYLDNQFIVWDATGITGEKEREKCRKTALQNRTLWMATAGFATPLMTSLFGNFIEPKVRDIVTEHDIKVASRRINGNRTKVDIAKDAIKDKALALTNKVGLHKKELHNERKIAKLIDSYSSSSKPADKQFFDELAQLLYVGDLSNDFRSLDDVKPIQAFNSGNLADALQEVYGRRASVDAKDLKEKLQGVNIVETKPRKHSKNLSVTKAIPKSGIFGSGNKAFQKDMLINLEAEDIKSITDALGENPTIEKVRELLTTRYKTLNNISANKPLPQRGKAEIERFMQFLGEDLSSENIKSKLRLSSQSCVQEDIIKFIDSIKDDMTLEQIKEKLQGLKQFSGSAVLRDDTLVNNFIDTVDKNFVPTEAFKKLLTDAQNQPEGGKNIAKFVSSIKDDMSLGQIKERLQNWQKTLSSNTDTNINAIGRCMDIMDGKNTYESLVDSLKTIEKPTEGEKHVIKFVNAMKDNVSLEELKTKLKAWRKSIEQNNAKYQQAIDGYIKAIDDSCTPETIKNTIRDMADLKVVKKPASEEKISEFIKSLGLNPSPMLVKEKLSEFDLSKSQIDDLLRRVNVNMDSFKEYILNYNMDFVVPLRRNVKEYLKTVNPIVGSRAESGYTRTYFAVMDNIFNKLGFVKKSEKELLERITMTTDEYCYENLREFFKNLVADVEFDSKEYHQLVEKLLRPLEKCPSEGLIDDAMRASKNIAKGLPAGDKVLNRAFLGSEDGSMINVIQNYIQAQKTNIEAIVARPVICANFEARLKEGKIRPFNKDITKPGEEKLLSAAKYLIYQGNVAAVNNKAGIADINFVELMKSLYDPEAFKNEPEFIQKHVKDLLVQIDEDFVKSNGSKELKNATRKYLRNPSLNSLAQKYATSLYNNKSWLKIFAPMAAVLVATTLLVQPLFGNIKKEFPEEGEKGGTK